MIYFLTVEDVLNIHQSRITKYGGSHGTRDEGLLLSALEMPKQGFGDEYFHSFPFEMAAAYLFHISKNHPFVDGNKRTSIASCLVFLQVNGYSVTASNQKIEDLVIDTATGILSKENITQFLAENSKKI